MAALSDPQYRHCALIVGHPGHELRVLAWVRRFRPLVVILTDGSGHGTGSRLDASRQVLLNYGAILSNLFGVVSDRGVYRLILERQYGFFRSLSDVLAAMLIVHQIDCVAGDATEGYNPTHDVCRFLIDRAVRLAEQATGRHIGNFAFTLTGHPSPPNIPEGSIILSLSDTEAESKLSEARAYGATVSGVLASEIEASLKKYGRDAFKQECFTPSDTKSDLARWEQEKPFYEVYGERRVASGLYSSLIRFRYHIKPLYRALFS